MPRDSQSASSLRRWGSRQDPACSLRGCQSVTRTYKPLTGVSGLLQKRGARWNMVEGGSVRPLDARARRIGLALAIVLIAGAVGVGCAYPSAVQPACADAVIEDWTNGALDSKYAPECYDAAI